MGKNSLRDIRPKPVKLMLDKERHLLFDLNALAALEDEYGGIEKALSAMEKGSVKAIRALIWAGLVHEDENLTPNAVGKMIGFAALSDLVAVLNEALGQALPQGDQGNG